MSYPDRYEITQRIYAKKRDRVLSADYAIKELDYLEYPRHKTAILTLSRVADPDVVVIYTYGGLVPHLFYKDSRGQITDHTGLHQQFTYDWINDWLDNNVAVAIFDMPSYFFANGHPWASSFYRTSPDRLREARQTIDLMSQRYPAARIVWAGMSYGCQEAAMISLEDTQLYKIASISGTWHVLPNYDAYQQGTRLDWYSVEQARTPILIAMHEKEVFEKAREEMQKTDSILVTNDVSADDGHFFKHREKEVVTAICDWFRDQPIPKIIP